MPSLKKFYNYPKSGAKPLVAWSRIGKSLQGELERGRALLV